MDPHSDSKNKNHNTNNKVHFYTLSSDNKSLHPNSYYNQSVNLTINNESISRDRSQSNINSFSETKNKRTNKGLVVTSSKKSFHQRQGDEDGQHQRPKSSINNREAHINMMQVDLLRKEVVFMRKRLTAAENQSKKLQFELQLFKTTQQEEWNKDEKTLNININEVSINRNVSYSQGPSQYRQQNFGLIQQMKEANLKIQNLQEELEKIHNENNILRQIINESNRQNQKNLKRIQEASASKKTAEDKKDHQNTQNLLTQLTQQRNDSHNLVLELQSLKRNKTVIEEQLKNHIKKHQENHNKVIMLNQKCLRQQDEIRMLKQHSGQLQFHIKQANQQIQRLNQALIMSKNNQKEVAFNQQFENLRATIKQFDEKTISIDKAIISINLIIRELKEKNEKIIIQNSSDIQVINQFRTRHKQLEELIQMLNKHSN